MTRIVETINEIRTIIKELKSEGKTIGFVPTMGALHEGHQTLMKQAKSENDVCIISVFVNPLQFGPEEDFDVYPRDIEGDHKKAMEADVDFIFHPSVKEMYPNELQFNIQINEMASVLDGMKRPGHFEGVVTVVNKLFNIITPDKAYFGKKDAQQLAIIEVMVQEFNHDIEVIGIDIVRENDGLAKSSRNIYLTDNERKNAVTLYESLKKAEAAFNNGERDSRKLLNIVTSYLQENSTGTVDDAAIFSYPDLKPVETIHGQVFIPIAVKYSKARLIDNIILKDVKND